MFLKIMQGYILNINKVRDEDLIVRIIAENHIYTLYRFYGSRHSTIHLGNKIDFTIQNDIRNISKLREPMHLPFSWENKTDKRYYWQQYLSLLNKHLKDIDNIDSFYFNHLENGAKKLEKEESRRCLLNMYVNLLEFEGRKNPLDKCIICNNKLYEEVIIQRGMISAHKHCIDGETLNKENIKKWLNYNGEFLTQNEVDKLWNIMLLGM